MKLFIKGKMFDNLDKMAVTGENGEAIYYLERDTSEKGHRVTVTAADGQKIGDIEQRGTTGLVSFAVFKDGAEVAVIKRKSKISIQPNFIVNGPDWDVAGSIFSTKSKVTKDGKTIAALKVALLESELDVADDADPIVVLAVVMAIRNALYRASIVGAAATTVGMTGIHN